MKFIIEGKIVEKDICLTIAQCTHEIVLSKKIDGVKHRYCKKCGIKAHADMDFSYLCGNSYCRCCD